LKTFSIQGGLKGPPSACSSAPDRIDVFAVVEGGSVWHWPLIGSTWEPPKQLAANGAFPPEGVCAISSDEGRVEVFAVDQNSRTPRWWRGNGNKFSVGPEKLNGPAIPAVPVAAVAASLDDIDVFAVDLRGIIQWWHWDGGRWIAPIQLPNGPSLSAQRIAAVSPTPGQLDVFAVGPDGHLWHWWKTAAKDWMVQDLRADLSPEGVSAVSWGPDRIDVFAASRAAGNGLQHWWTWTQGNPSAFSAAKNLGGSLATGTVSAVSHAPNRLDVFGISRDQRIAQWQWDGQRWTGPDFRGENIPAGDVSAVVPKVSAVVPKRHRLDVFVTGAGNTLRKWPGGGLENATNQPWINWPANHPTNPAGLLRPDSLEELVTIVKEAEQLGRGVRAVGSGWSNSDVAVIPVAPTSGYVIETDMLNAVLTDVLSTSLRSDRAGMNLFHVEAG
jgi:hypothetical protein